MVKIYLPPLRERKEDIPLLISHFTRKFSGGKKRFNKKAIQILMKYSWPGNIRELENVISYAIVMAKGDEITEKDLPEEILAGKEVLTPENLNLTEIEKETIKNALKMTGGNKTLAAKALGISKRTLLNKIKQYDI